MPLSTVQIHVKSLALFASDTVSIFAGSALTVEEPLLQQPLGSPAYAACTLSSPNNGTLSTISQNP